MVLVNGSEGIGTGYSTSVPNYSVREIVANLKRLIHNQEPEKMVSKHVYQGSLQNFGNLALYFVLSVFCLHFCFHSFAFLKIFSKYFGCTKYLSFIKTSVYSFSISPSRPLFLFLSFTLPLSSQPSLSLPLSSLPPSLPQDSLL